MYILKKMLTDGRIITTEQEVEPDLQQLQEAVGGYIELLMLPEGDLYINEEGKLYNLPQNPVAEKFFLSHGGMLFPGDFIVGDAIYITSSPEKMT